MTIDPTQSNFTYHGTFEEALEQAKKDIVRIVKEMVHEANVMGSFLYYE